MGLIDDLAGEPKPQLHREVWGRHAGCLDTLEKETRININKQIYIYTTYYSYNTAPSFSQSFNAVTHNWE